MHQMPCIDTSAEAGIVINEPTILHERLREADCVVGGRRLGRSLSPVCADAKREYERRVQRVLTGDAENNLRMTCVAHAQGQKESIAIAIWRVMCLYDIGIMTR